MDALLERIRHKYVAFPKSEYQSRINRLQKLMVEKQINGFFISQTENVSYFTGFRSYNRLSKHRPIVAIIPQSGDPILVLPFTEIGDAVAFSWSRDIRTWNDGEDYSLLYVDVLKEMGLSTAQIGAELGDDTNIGMPWLKWNKLQQELPNVQIKDGSPLIWRVRAIKSDLEIEKIRRAAYLTDRGIEEAWKIMRPGVTEKELVRIMNITFAENFADPYWMIVRSGPEMGFLFSKYATDRKLEKGDIVLLDVGAVYDDYCGDLIRMASVGPPSRSQREFYTLAVECNYACKESIKPGVRLSEPVEVRNKFYMKHYPKASPAHFVGHGIGLTGHELPRLRMGEDSVFEVGMTFTIEPGFSASASERYILEDMFVLTANRSEPLSNASRELYISST